MITGKDGEPEVISVDTCTRGSDNSEARCSTQVHHDSEHEEDESSDDGVALSGRIDDLRKSANRNKTISNEKMVKKHDAKRYKKTVDFDVGDLVSVAIPRIDRGNCDFRRLPAMVCDTRGNKDRFFLFINSLWNFK